MTLADSRGRFLYEIRPDLFPYDYLTHDEMQLWGIYYEHKNERLKANG